LSPLRILAVNTFGGFDTSILILRFLLLNCGIQNYEIQIPQLLSSRPQRGIPSWGDIKIHLKRKEIGLTYLFNLFIFLSGATYLLIVITLADFTILIM